MNTSTDINSADTGGVLPTESQFSRVQLVLGGGTVERLSQLKVIIFGVGGVGSWCAECLVRTGITQLTMVDFDNVCPSNINRQLMATTTTVGRPKVEVLRERLLAINPQAQIDTLQRMFTEEDADDFHLGSYDYIIDAIDSLKDKAALILLACQTQATLYSSMGAALKLDPSRIRTTEFWKIEGDPLARALRKRFKHEGRYPARKFTCVYSDEPARPRTEGQPNGSLAHITAIFGFTLASLVINDAHASVCK